MLFRIIVLALQLGVVFAGAFAFFFDGNVSLSYLAGVGAGVVYFLLLAKKVEAIGARYSALPLRQPPISEETPAIDDIGEDTQAASGAEERTNTVGSIGPAPRSFFSLSPAFLGETLANLRFLVPVLLLAALVEKDQVFEHFPLKPFSLLPRNEYIAAMGGFLTLRLALYLSEVAKEFRVQDILGILPGTKPPIRSLAFSEGDGLSNMEDSASSSMLLSAFTQVLLLLSNVLQGPWRSSHASSSSRRITVQPRKSCRIINPFSCPIAFYSSRVLSQRVVTKSLGNSFSRTATIRSQLRLLIPHSIVVWTFD